MKKRFYSTIPCLLVLLLSVKAPAVPAAAATFQRDVLGVFSSDDGQTLARNNLRSDVEMVLNHLGLRLVYHDIATGLPEEADMHRYRGIVVWFDSSKVRGAGEFWIWLGAQLDQGRRVVLLGGSNPRVDFETGQTVPLETINATLSRMGLQAAVDYAVLPLDIEVVDKKTDMVEFERGLGGEAGFFSHVISISKRNKVFLTLKKVSTGSLSHAVVLTPNGGFVLPGYVRYMDPVTSLRQWRINPFAFFEAALGVERSPRPDCTTLNGARIYFSHVDGDGLPSKSRVMKGKNTGEVLYERVLKKYRDLPVTVSVIGNDIDVAGRGKKSSLDAARKIYKLAYVEAASHTYTHPLVWQEKSQGAGMSGAGFQRVNERRELQSSAALIEKLALPPGKKCAVIFWTGDCRPGEKALFVAHKAGLLNINGGDTRMDPVYPSYAYVAPLYRKVGPYYQVYTAASNENLYTKLWSDNFGGFKNVIKTFQNTESPRRVAPINVYYHFYSAEREASLDALTQVFEWVRKQGVFPIFTSRYVRIVQGFISTEITPVGKDAWRVADNGALRTIRFDFHDRIVDMKRSRGVLGFRQHQGSLYVFLDQAPEHDILLTAGDPVGPYLDYASADVEQLVRDKSGGWSFHTSPFDSARYVWKNLPQGGSYEITARAGKRTISKRAGAPHGTLDVTLGISGGATVTVQLVKGGRGA